MGACTGDALGPGGQASGPPSIGGTAACACTLNWVIRLDLPTSSCRGTSRLTPVPAARVVLGAGDAITGASPSPDPRWGRKRPARREKRAHPVAQCRPPAHLHSSRSSSPPPTPTCCRARRTDRTGSRRTNPPARCSPTGRRNECQRSSPGCHRPRRPTREIRAWPVGLQVDEGRHRDAAGDGSAATPSASARRTRQGL